MCLGVNTPPKGWSWVPNRIPVFVTTCPTPLLSPFTSKNSWAWSKLSWTHYPDQIISKNRFLGTTLWGNTDKSGLVEKTVMMSWETYPKTRLITWGCSNQNWSGERDPQAAERREDRKGGRYQIGGESTSPLDSWLSYFNLNCKWH